MSDKDTVTKDYMQDREIFADAFNFYLYQGRQVIKPEQLRPLDATSIVLPYGEEGKPVRIIRRSETNLGDLCADAYLHYAMPVRNMLYDAIQYVAQVEEIAKSHRRSDQKPETRAEFLSGFYQTDKLLPVITLTVYFGADEWVAPKDLHGMLAAEEDILPYVDNYRLHLIAPAEIEDSEFVRFHTELSLALRYLKYSKDKIRLKALINEEAAFRSVSRKTADLVNVVTKSKLHYSEREERVNMCEAIEGIIHDAKAEGIEEGRAEGIEKGRAEGIEKGRAEGIEGKVETLLSLIEKGILTIADAAQLFNMTVPEFEEEAKLLKQ